MSKTSPPSSKAWLAPDSGFARQLIDGLCTDTFRTTALVCAAFAATTLCLSLFIYWQTAVLQTARTDRSILNEFAILSREPAALTRQDVETHFAEDLDRLTFAALFGRDGKPVAGGLAARPPGLPPDGKVHETEAIRTTRKGVLREPVRAVAAARADGGLLVVGRSEQDLRNLRSLTRRAMAFGVLPALLATLAIGLFASLRTLARVSAMNRAISRIMEGHIADRLPAADTADALDQLARSCNRMLDEIERLIDELKGVGDNIAHDLRAPLARLRTRLEFAARTAPGADQLLAKAIGDLDQALALITALLRIGQIENAQRRSGFAAVDLTDILTETYDLYRPVAEARGLHFSILCEGNATVQGDRDMLLELCFNLTDNSIKFAPEGGRVWIELRDGADGPVMRFADSGKGIDEADRARVTSRFYRSAKMQAVPGHGVGLSLVAAIARLHGFSLSMHNLDPGFSVDLVCTCPDSDPKT